MFSFFVIIFARSVWIKKTIVSLPLQPFDREGRGEGGQWSELSTSSQNYVHVLTHLVHIYKARGGGLS
jgi:hypothetical protein